MFELLTENFEELKSKNFSLIDFWQKSCPECLALKSLLEEIEKDFSDVYFYSLDCQKERKLAISQKVFGLPAVLLFSKGELVCKLQKEDCTIENIKKALNEKH